MRPQPIKKRRYTNDLVNAVVVAVKSGMFDEVWNKWRLTRKQ